MFPERPEGAAGGGRGPGLSRGELEGGFGREGRIEKGEAQRVPSRKGCWSRGARW